MGGKKKRKGEREKYNYSIYGKGQEDIYLCVCVCVCVCVRARVYVQSLSCVRLFVTTWAVTHQAPLSMGFSRQEYWSGMPCSSPGDHSDPGIETWSPALQADFFFFFYC